MFSAVLNNRLIKFSDEFELITNAPAGFRKGFSTSPRFLCRPTALYIFARAVGR
jgi:hypothetical protein